MKSIQLAALFIGLSFLLVSCSKDTDGEGSDCEDNNTTTVKFVNSGTTKMRVQVAYQLTPQFEPIDPVVTLDLDAGETVSKTIPAERYMLVWKNGCPDNCNLATSYAKTYASCETYTEQLAN